MKPQDIIFLISLITLLIIRKSNWMVIFALVSLAISIPLFVMHVFFTAEHLTYYAGGFFVIATIFKIYENRN